MAIPVMMTPEQHKKILKELHSQKEIIVLNSDALIAYQLVAYEALLHGDMKPIAKVTKGF